MSARATGSRWRYRCRCGHHGRWHRDPNGARADAERHLGLDTDRHHPCRDGHTSESAMVMERHDRDTGTTVRVAL